MKKFFNIVHYQKSPRGYRHIYTLHFEGEEDNELDRFLKDSDVCNHKDKNQLIARLSELLNKRGFQDKFFKFDQNSTNPTLGYLKLAYRSSLRLYCSVFGENLLIVGGGAVKTTRRRQETPQAQQAFERLKYADELIYERIRNNQIYVSENNELRGELEYKEE